MSLQFKYSTVADSLIPEGWTEIYRIWGSEAIDGLWCHHAKIRQSGFGESTRYAIIVFFDYYICTNGFTQNLDVNNEQDVRNAFCYATKEEAIATWEKFKSDNDFAKYEEFGKVALKFDFDLDLAVEFYPIEYAGCLEEGLLTQICEPTVWAVYFKDGEINILNYALSRALVKHGCTQADVDAIADYLNSQNQ